MSSMQAWAQHRLARLGAWLLRGDDPDRPVAIGALVIGVLFVTLEIWERL